MPESVVEGDGVMLLQFTLSMPRVRTWNGRWSGEGRNYCLFRSVNAEKANKILDKGYYTYSWGDGWRAGITVEPVRRRSRSDGFCGYDWMVDSIVKHGTIQSLDVQDKI